MEFFLRFIFIIITILAGCDNRLNCEMSIKLKEVDKMIKVQREMINFLLNKEMLQLMAENTFIPDTLYFRDVKGESKKITEIIEKENKKLFFFFNSEESCNECVNYVMEELKKLSKKVKIVIISNFKDKRSQIIFSNNINDSEINVYSSDNLDHIFNKDLLKYPFLFVINEDYTIDKVYIHDKSYNYLLSDYLQIINNVKMNAK